MKTMVITYLTRLALGMSIGAAVLLLATPVAWGQAQRDADPSPSGQREADRDVRDKGRDGTRSPRDAGREEFNEGRNALDAGRDALPRRRDASEDRREM